MGVERMPYGEQHQKKKGIAVQCEEMSHLASGRREWPACDTPDRRHVGCPKWNPENCHDMERDQDRQYFQQWGENVPPLVGKEMAQDNKRPVQGSTKDEGPVIA